jgi:hypothetical protein
MQIRTHIGVSVDGFVASADRRPAVLSMPDFVPHESHGYPDSSRAAPPSSWVARHLTRPSARWIS